MKKIAYLSTLKIPPGSRDFSVEMMKILNKSRINNKEKNITGVLLVSGDEVLQILEGESSVIASTFYKIRLDSRHKDVSIILNGSCEERVFPNWSMRMISSNTPLHNKVVNTINKCFGNDFVVVSVYDKKRVSNILEVGGDSDSFSGQKKGEVVNRDFTTIDNIGQHRHDFQKKAMKLKIWPRPSQVSMTSDVIRVCSKLSSGWCLLSDFNGGGVCKNDSSVSSILLSLDSFGLLLYKDSMADMHSEGVGEHSHDDVKERFSQVLRRFIKTTKH